MVVLPEPETPMTTAMTGLVSVCARAADQPEGLALMRRSTPRISIRTALAKPSFSLLSVTAFACAFTSALELPMAMEKPLLRNMRTSLGISPMVAICSGRISRCREREVTTAPLLARG